MGCWGLEKRSIKRIGCWILKLKKENDVREEKVEQCKDGRIGLRRFGQRTCVQVTSYLGDYRLVKELKGFVSAQLIDCALIKEERLSRQPAEKAKSYYVQEDIKIRLGRRGDLGRSSRTQREGVFLRFNSQLSLRTCDLQSLERLQQPLGYMTG